MDLTALSRFAAAAAIACTCFSAAHAQEPAKSAPEPSKAAVAAAREVLAMKGATNMFIPVPIGVVESVKRSFLPTNPNLGRELNEVAAVLQKEFEGKRAELVDDVATIYARRFTEQELKELVVFFKTPLGQKWAREEPAAIEEGLREAQRWSDAFSEVVMGRFRSEMQKRGHPL
jgi:uncharacterized protein